MQEAGSVHVMVLLLVNGAAVACAELCHAVLIVVCRYDFAEWLSSRVMMQLSNEAGQSQVSRGQANTVTVTWSRPPHLDTPERSQQGSWGKIQLYRQAFQTCKSHILFELPQCLV
jgi:hypothetical protein